jgi:undecaprenyl-diphosphatase
MPIWQAIILGVVQGLAEFLPISSSAHLILVPWLFGWSGDGGVAFDVALHWGTLLAVVFVFWRDWIRLISAGFKSVFERRVEGDPDRKLFWALVIATVPAAILGKLLNKLAEEQLRSPMLIAVTMAIMGVVLWWADRRGQKDQDAAGIPNRPAFGIGVAQAAALVPGVSRSGVTISAGLFLGYSRESIARFSFLMSTPIIFGAGLVKIPELIHKMRAGEAEVGATALAAGVLASAVTGFLAVKWMLRYLRRNTYGAFAIYRVAVAVLIVGLWLMGKR